MILDAFLFLVIWAAVYTSACLYHRKFVPFVEIWRSLFITGVLAMIISVAFWIIISTVMWMVWTVLVVGATVGAVFLILSIGSILGRGRAQKGQ